MTNEAELKDLLGTLAKVVREQVGDKVTVVDEATGAEREVYTASPALIGQAINLLKMNHISVDVESNDDLGALGKLLADKQLHGRAKLASVSKIKES